MWWVVTFWDFSLKQNTGLDGFFFSLSAPLSCSLDKTQVMEQRDYVPSALIQQPKSCRILQVGQVKWSNGYYNVVTSLPCQRGCDSLSALLAWQPFPQLQCWGLGWGGGCSLFTRTKEQG